MSKCSDIRSRKARNDSPEPTRSAGRCSCVQRTPAGTCLELALASPVTVSTVLADEVIAIIDLGTLGGEASHAYGINDHGQVVGWSETAEGQDLAFLREDGVMIDIGTLGGDRSRADDINDHGQIVGTSHTAEGTPRATLRTVSEPALTPEKIVADITERVAAAFADGTLNRGQANALTAQLEAAQRQLDWGEYQGRCQYPRRLHQPLRGHGQRWETDRRASPAAHRCGLRCRRAARAVVRLMLLETEGQLLMGAGRSSGYADLAASSCRRIPCFTLTSSRAYLMV